MAKQFEVKVVKPHGNDNGGGGTVQEGEQVVRPGGTGGLVVEDWEAFPPWIGRRQM